jgi:beta-glucuronidase
MRRFLGFLLTASSLLAAPARVVSLNGDWQFALDPLRKGVEHGWAAAPFDGRAWDRVDVPHSWPADKRYPYIGVAWYRRSFPAPARIAGDHVRLRFEAAFARAGVWLNGKQLGRHEGGYTPFDFDVTSVLIEGENWLAVEVDSAWTESTMPGARPNPSPNGQVYPYFPWGGLVRDVELEILPAVHIVNARIWAQPDLSNGSARVRVAAWVRNTSPQDRQVELVTDTGGRAAVRAPAGEIAELNFEQVLAPRQVKLWDLDHPNLATLRLTLNTGHERSLTYGVRKVEVRGTELLLNGKPIRLGGANRAGDHPRFGLVDPLAVVEADGRLLKEAGLELARLQHYAIPTALLDWADRNGLLIVGEAAQWGFLPEQMDNPDIRRDFQRQHREMIERDWNHPSVIACSVGNEYASDTPSGVRWTRDMYAFTRGLDPSRLITFAGNHADRTSVAPDREGSAYVDFVMINVYGQPESLGSRLDRLHSMYPAKPILLSEYGIRADQVPNEDARVQWFSQMLAIFRARPWIAGASVWSFNDYRSLYPGTNPSGFRPWGLVDEERKPRGAYGLLQSELRALLLENAHRDAGCLVLSIRNRPDFPSFTVSGATLHLEWMGPDGAVLSTTEAPIPTLDPGQAFETKLDAPARTARVRIVARRAPGWIALEREVDFQ